MPEPAGPDEPNHSKARALPAESAVSSRAPARSRPLHAPRAADRRVRCLRALTFSRQDTHVNYIFGAAYRDGPAGPAPAGTPRVRKSFSKAVRSPAWTPHADAARHAGAGAAVGARGERMRRLWAGAASSLSRPA